MWWGGGGGVQVDCAIFFNVDVGATVFVGCGRCFDCEWRGGAG